MRASAWWASLLSILVVAAGCTSDQPKPEPPAPAVSQPATPTPAPPVAQPTPPVAQPTPPVAQPTPPVAEPTPPVATTGGPDGAALFEAQKCGMCHLVTSLGLGKGKKGPDLTGEGKKRDATWIRGWMKKEIQLNGKAHLKALTLPDADFDALVKWLGGL